MDENKTPKKPPLALAHEEPLDASLIDGSVPAASSSIHRPADGEALPGSPPDPPPAPYPTFSQAQPPDIISVEPGLVRLRWQPVVQTGVVHGVEGVEYTGCAMGYTLETQEVRTLSLNTT
jgi:hypothetical protein